MERHFIWCNDYLRQPVERRRSQTRRTLTRQAAAVRIINQTRPPIRCISSSRSSSAVSASSAKMPRLMPLIMYLL